MMSPYGCLDERLPIFETKTLGVLNELNESVVQNCVQSFQAGAHGFPALREPGFQKKMNSVGADSKRQWRENRSKRRP
jgi:hypothetical protein